MNHIERKIEAWRTYLEGELYSSPSMRYMMRRNENGRESE